MKINYFLLPIALPLFLIIGSVSGQNHVWNWAKIEAISSSNNNLASNTSFFKLPGGPVNLIGGHNVRAIWNSWSPYWDGEQFGEASANLTPKAEVSIGSIAYMTIPGDVMMKTTNSGATWDTLTTPTNECDHQSVINSEEVILTSGNTMYKSTDGGLTWNSIWNLGNWNIISVDINDVGYGLCSRENIYSERMAFTEDGGLSWTNISSVNTYYKQIFMVSNTEALAIKDGTSLLYRTTSLGSSWTEVIPESVQSICQVSDLEYYVLTLNELYHTSDGFATYDVRSTPVPIYSNGAIWFDSPSHGVSWVMQTNQMGDGYSGALFFETFDGGLTWQTTIPKLTDSTTLTTLTTSRNDVIQHFDGDRLWVKTSNPGFLLTEDGGINWKVKTNSSCLLPVAAALSGDTIFTLSNDLVLSTDEGISCTVVNNLDGSQIPGSILTNDLIALHFTDANTGYLLATDNLYKTTNGGITFTEIESALSNNIRFWHWLNDSTFYLIGNSVSWTSDGGETWNYFTSQYDDNADDPYIYDLFMLNENEGWVCTYEGMYHTTNGGSFWETVNVPYFADKVIFSDSLNGTAIGNYNVNNGIVSTTNDGGITWAVEEFPTLDLNYMAITDTKVFIFALSGDILIADLSSTMEGDFNGDGLLNNLDADAFVQCFGCTENCGSCDLDGDGIVGISDFMLLISML